MLPLFDWFTDRNRMGILYALVGRGSVVLAEYSGTTTNASVIARQILEKIPGNNDTHVSYSQDRYIFHVKRTDGLTVLCMADDTAGSAFSDLFTSPSVKPKSVTCSLLMFWIHSLQGDFLLRFSRIFIRSSCGLTDEPFTPRSLTEWTRSSLGFWISRWSITPAIPTPIGSIGSKVKCLRCGGFSLRFFE